MNCCGNDNVPEVPQPHDASPGWLRMYAATVLLLLPPLRPQQAKSQVSASISALLSAISGEVGLRRSELHPCGTGSTSLLDEVAVS